VRSTTSIAAVRARTDGRDRTSERSRIRGISSLLLLMSRARHRDKVRHESGPLCEWAVYLAQRATVNDAVYAALRAETELYRFVLLRGACLSGFSRTESQGWRDSDR